MAPVIAVDGASGGTKGARYGSNLAAMLCCFGGMRREGGAARAVAHWPRGVGFAVCAWGATLLLAPALQ